MDGYFKLFFFFLLFGLLPTAAQANHMVGGEFAYRCLGNNKFEITLVLWLDCIPENDRVIQSDDTSTYNIFERVTGTRVVSAKWINPISTEIITDGPAASDECILNKPEVCLMKKKFVFIDSLTPSSHGYTIAYQRFARTASIVNINNPGNTGATYTCDIPPFTDGECVNNSAVFINNPPQVICQDFNFYYDFSATDADGDSLSYSLCEAYKSDLGAGKPVFFSGPDYESVEYLSPYSMSNPVAGMPGVSLDANTGILSLVPNALGRFVVKVCVTEWRGGVPIANVSRDVLFLVTPCIRTVSASMPFIQEAPDTYIISCNSKTVKFRNTSIGGVSYLWDFGVPGETSTEYEPEFTYPDTGVYKVKLIVNPGSTCSDSITKLVKVYPEFIVNFGIEGGLCFGDTVYFTDSTFATYPPVIHWEWQFGNGTTSNVQNPEYVYPESGDYTVTLTAESEKGCTGSATKVFVGSSFKPNAGNDTMIVIDYPFSLNASGGDTYDWLSGDYLSARNIPNPAINFPTTGVYEYVVKITDNQGCELIDTIVVTVVNKSLVMVPTAFSPNGDGLNDLLTPILVGFTNVEFFRIYNRWGQSVYLSYQSIGWDGTYKGQPLSIGVYYWVIGLRSPDGVVTVEKGDVTLVR